MEPHARQRQADLEAPRQRDRENSHQVGEAGGEGTCRQGEEDDSEGAARVRKVLGTRGEAAKGGECPGLVQRRDGRQGGGVEGGEGIVIGVSASTTADGVGGCRQLPADGKGAHRPRGANS